jgi:hypothetical protein
MTDDSYDDHPPSSYTLESAWAEIKSLRETVDQLEAVQKHAEAERQVLLGQLQGLQMAISVMMQAAKSA